MKIDGVEIEVKDILQLILMIKSLYNSYQATQRVDEMNLEEARELADRLWPLLMEIHTKNKEL